VGFVLVGVGHPGGNGDLVADGGGVMKPGKYGLSLYRGDTSRWKFTLWADEAKTEPIDLAGASVAAQIRAVGGTWTSPAAVLDCVIEAPNIIRAELPTSATLPGRGTRSEWDLQITWPSGDVQTVLAGGVDVMGDVTRAVA
jgi:hypothetical protein